MRLIAPSSLAVGVALGAALLLSGCTPASEPPVAPQDLLGETLAFADQVIPEDASNSVQDVGQLFDARERFRADEWGSSRYVVVAFCSDTRDVRRAANVQLGVVSVDALSPGEVNRARDGAYVGDIGCTEGFQRAR